MSKPKSFKDLLLIHDLAFIALIAIAAISGLAGIYSWDKSAQESRRINLLVQEIQQTRGDLYRQMKELFDGYFLADTEAKREYDAYTVSINQHFVKLKDLAVGHEEKAAIMELKESYDLFISGTSDILNRHQSFTSERLEKALNSTLESEIFSRYELLSARAETLLAIKQAELQEQLDKAKNTSFALLLLPLILAVILLLFSRTFLKRAIVKPIEGLLHATAEISAGRLRHKAPEEGVAELSTLSQAINGMAEKLEKSREALIQSEKQAAQGLLVPMLAHNIRNPLSSIRATAQVADNSDLDNDTRDSLQGIINTVDRLERWTGSLLAYLHPLKPNPSRILLQKIINGALEPLLLRLKDKSITIELPDWNLRNDTIYTDEHLLEQAIYNLLQNAIEASPPHSKIEIRAKTTKQSVQLILADRGSGMPFTPDPAASSPGPSTKRFGTGLGIPFAFKVCEALDGKISFQSREGGGTVVTIELPRQYSLS